VAATHWARFARDVELQQPGLRLGHELFGLGDGRLGGRLTGCGGGNDACEEREEQTERGRAEQGQVGFQHRFLHESDGVAPPAMRQVRGPGS